MKKSIVIMEDTSIDTFVPVSFEFLLEPCESFFSANLDDWYRLQMHTIRRYAKCVSVMLLVVTLTLVIGGAYANAYENGNESGNSFPREDFDFTITASRTLIKIQPSASGSLVIWVKPYCTNSTSFALCDTTVLQTVNLQVSGCPTGSYCSLDRTQVLNPPLYSGSSEFVVYSFSMSTTSVTTVTVTGTDQFGHSHATQFGVILCYC
jgi:hypothetical protein